MVLGGVVIAQEGEGIWSNPANLSQSGSAGAPSMVADSSRRYHVLWEDEFTGIMYATGNGTTWDESISLADLPFGESFPLMTPGQDSMHAFWVAPNEGAEGVTLWYSAAPITQLTRASAWTTPVAVTSGAQKIAALEDDLGRVQLLSIRADESVSGVYHQYVFPGGTWTEPQELYSSPYLRLAGEESNLQLVSGPGETLFAAWDNPAREEVLLTRSENGGAGWEDVRVVDRRLEGDSLTSAGPSMLRVATLGNEVHLTWQAGHAAAVCTQYHQLSRDIGDNWEAVQPAFAAGGDCAADVQLFVAASAPMMLLRSEAGASLTVWNGTAWSEPTAQPELSGFTEPEILRTVNYNCGQALASVGDVLVTANCGESNGRDVYAQSRNLEAFVSEESAPAPVWSEPANLVDDEGMLFTPQLVVDPASGLHAFWTSEPASNVGSPDESLFDGVTYSYWNGEGWSNPAEILSGERISGSPAFAMGEDGRLKAVWSSGNGQIWFSQVDAGRAAVNGEWSEPMALPIPRQAGNYPDLAVGRDGVVYVVYAVPRNEERGIYLTRSADGGSTWSSPQQIFDGIAAGWEEVGAPTPATTDENSLHVLWRRSDAPDTGDDARSDSAGRLYYARSGDRGDSWSEPELVGAGILQGTGTVLHQEMAGVGAQVVHRIWQVWDGERLILWHAYSVDNGGSWSRAERVGGLGDVGGAAALTVDGAGQTHLLQVTAGVAGPQQEMRHWQWEAAGWRQMEGLLLGSLSVPAVDGLAAAVDANSRLGVLMAAEGGGDGQQLNFVERDLPAPGVLPTPLPTLTPTPAAAGTPEPTPLPEPTATVVFPTTPGESVQLPFGLGSMQAQDGLVVGLVLALGATVVVVALALFAQRRAGRR